MKKTLKYSDITLVVEDTLIAKLGKLGTKHVPNEFGGFLIGEYSPDFKTVYVRDNILPKKYKGTPLYFERSIDGLEPAFNKAFLEKGHYYIGEWHTHPNGPTSFSQRDLSTMIDIAECETVMITNPILLIISINGKKLDYKFYFYKNKTLIPYE